MSQINLVERVPTRISLPEGKGGKYKVRMMGWAPGDTIIEGSSADYPVDVVKRDFAKSFPKGTRMRANHDGLCEGGGGDILRVIAKTTETPWAEDDGMYTHVIFSEQWTPFIKEFGDVVGLSISAAGVTKEVDEEADDYDPEARPVVERFLSAEEYPYNALDVVEAPGADGRIVEALESARKQVESMAPGTSVLREQAQFASIALDEKTSGTVPSQNDKEEISMDKQELAEMLAESEARNKAAVEALIESLKPTETPEEIQYENVAEAAFQAGLSEGSRKAVYAAVKNGSSIEESIQAQVNLRKEIEEDIKKESAGREFTLPSIQEGFVSGASSNAGLVSDADFDAFVRGEI